MRVDGVYGTLQTPLEAHHTVLMVAGGVGITPMTHMLEALVATARKTSIRPTKTLESTTFKKGGNDENKQILTTGLRNVVLAWSLRSMDLFNVVDGATALSTLVGFLRARQIHVVFQLYLTRGRSSPSQAPMKPPPSASMIAAATGDKKSFGKQQQYPRSKQQQPSTLASIMQGPLRGEDDDNDELMEMLLHPGHRQDQDHPPQREAVCGVNNDDDDDDDEDPFALLTGKSRRPRDPVSSAYQQRHHHLPSASRNPETGGAASSSPSTVPGGVMPAFEVVTRRLDPKELAAKVKGLAAMHHADGSRCHSVGAYFCAPPALVDASLAAVRAEIPGVQCHVEAFNF